MKPLPTKAFKVRLTKADAKKAKPFNDFCGCLLWQALRRQFGSRDMAVWCSDVDFSSPYAERDERVWFTIKDHEKIRGAYDEKREKIKQPFRPFEVTLVPK